MWDYGKTMGQYNELWECPTHVGQLVTMLMALVCPIHLHYSASGYGLVPPARFY